MTFADFFWLLMVVVAPMVLGVALIYAILNRKRLTLDGRRLRKRPVRELSEIKR